MRKNDLATATEYLTRALHIQDSIRLAQYDLGSVYASLNKNDEAAAALKVVQFTATPTFGQLFSDIAGEISPIQGVEVPSKYPLSVQAYKQFQTDRIDPVFGIRSPMDTPPATPITSKSKVSGATDGIFTAVQAIADPLITDKLTPAKAAKKIQQDVSWYFKGKS